MSRLLLLADTCYRQNLRKDDILNAATIYQYVFGQARLETLPGQTPR